jgi:hypothetical protein
MRDIRLFDFQTDTLTLVSVSSNLNSIADGPSDWPAISGDGRFVIYRTLASVLLPK